MKENNLKNTYFLAYGAAIAAIYVALTMAFFIFSAGSFWRNCGKGFY